MKYYGSNKITINFLPWFHNNYRLNFLKIVEKIGQLAYGTMELSLDEGQDSLKLLTDQYTGKIIIEQESGGNRYEIDIFITNRSYYRNKLSINFICVKDGLFINQKLIESYTGLTNTIKLLYPGKLDIRCESDVQTDDSIKLFQNNTSSLSFLIDLCKGFKKQSIFAFGWEGLLIKDIIGINSKGLQEPVKSTFLGKLETRVDRNFEKYNPILYNGYYNPWEDTEKKVIDEDYTDRESMNLRVLSRYGSSFYIHKDYLTMIENKVYNEPYYSLSGSQFFRITIEEGLPNYKLGDVIKYKDVNILSDKSTTWPFENFLVSGNEFLCSTDESNKVDFRGKRFSFTTSLLGLDKNGKLTIDSTEEDDPLKTEE